MMLLISAFSIICTKVIFAASVKSRDSETSQSCFIDTFSMHLDLNFISFLFPPLQAFALVMISSVLANSQDCTTLFLLYRQSTLDWESWETTAGVTRSHLTNVPSFSTVFMGICSPPLITDKLWMAAGLIWWGNAAGCWLTLWVHEIPWQWGEYKVLGVLSTHVKHEYES